MTDRRHDLGSLFGDDAPTPSASSPRNAPAGPSLFEQPALRAVEVPPSVGFLSDEAKAEAKAAALAAAARSKAAARQGWANVKTNTPIVLDTINDLMAAHRMLVVWFLLAVIAVDIIGWAWFVHIPDAPTPVVATTPTVAAPTAPLVRAVVETAPPSIAVAPVPPPTVAPIPDATTPAVATAQDVPAPVAPAPRPVVKPSHPPAPLPTHDAEQSAQMDKWFNELKDKK